MIDQSPFANKFFSSKIITVVVVNVFHLILDRSFQLLIDGIIHVVPYRDFTPFVFSVTYYSTTKNVTGFPVFHTVQQ